MPVSESAAPPSRRNFSTRSIEPEWLDGADLDAAELAVVLEDLARFNTAMLGHFPILRWLRRAVRGLDTSRPIRLVDAGCGYGDLLRAIRRWADRRGLELGLLGLDLNHKTIRIARAATDPGDRIEYQVGDALDFRPREPVDLIVSSLLAHHLGNPALVEFLRWIERTARRGWLVCDLHRHPIPYHVIGFTGRLARLHPMVVHDGQISVMRALDRREWEECLETAGIARDAAAVRWFLFRWLIGRLR
jgi:SAM-dependent methyltransferase